MNSHPPLPSRKPATRPTDPGQLPWLAAVTRALEGLQYGQLVLTVHQGEVVQVDRTERTRLSSGTSGRDAY